MKHLLFLSFLFVVSVVYGQNRPDIPHRTYAEELKFYQENFGVSEFDFRYRYPETGAEFDYFRYLYSDDCLGDTLVVNGKTYFFSQSSMKQFPEYMFGEKDWGAVEAFPKLTTSGLSDKGYVLHFKIGEDKVAYVDRVTYNGYIYPDSMKLSPMDMRKIAALTGSELTGSRTIRANWLNGNYRMNDMQMLTRAQSYTGERYVAVFKAGKLTDIRIDKEKDRSKIPVVDLKQKPDTVWMRNYVPEYVYYVQPDKTVKGEKRTAAAQRLRKKIMGTYKKEPFLDDYCVKVLRKMGVQESLTSDERILVGEYACTISRELNNDTVGINACMTQNSNTSYKPDWTYEDKGTVVFVIRMAKLDQADLTLEYDFSDKGTWKIEDGFLLETTNGEFECKFVKSNAEADLAKMLVEVMKANVPKMVMKQASGRSRIAELTGEKLVIVKDWVEFTLTRIGN
ncbi:hypothetical protein [Bacteroides helcogenes]|nr:hypothetical protein [Bacteroides helcogenes]MDY5237170.1 hypothetical protein [Bacteroides helcogenes]